MRRLRFVAVSVVLLAAAFVLWYRLAITLPVYHYESSDGGMDEIEVPWKGRDFDVVLARFEEYQAQKGDSSVTLYRTSTRTWSAPRLWWENLSHPRWDLPYKESSRSAVHVAPDATSPSAP